MDHASPVKLFAALLCREETGPDKCLEFLSREYGPVDYLSPGTPFDVTDYYEKEMGAPLIRCFASFAKNVLPSLLPGIKLKSVEIEDALRRDGRRAVNIDTGYLDFDKVVLASTKKGPYKIYMDRGIWADMTLHYEKGAFLPFPWTFADFKDGRYGKFLLHIRELYKKSDPVSRPL